MYWKIIPILQELKYELLSRLIKPSSGSTLPLMSIRLFVLDSA